MKRWVFHRLWGSLGWGWGQGERAGSEPVPNPMTHPKPWAEDAHQEGGAASSTWVAHHRADLSHLCPTSSPGVRLSQPPKQIQDQTRASGCSDLPRVRLYLPVLRRR